MDVTDAEYCEPVTDAHHNTQSLSCFVNKTFIFLHQPSKRRPELHDGGVMAQSAALVNTNTFMHCLKPIKNTIIVLLEIADLKAAGISAFDAFLL